MQPPRVLIVDDEAPIVELVRGCLARDPGVVVGRQSLFDRVWDPDFIGDDHLVDVHIGNVAGFSRS